MMHRDEIKTGEPTAKTIQDCIDSLFSSLDALEKALDFLDQKIVPVKYAEAIENQKDEETLNGSSCPVINSLERINDRIIDTRKKIIYLMGLVAL